MLGSILLPCYRQEQIEETIGDFKSKLINHSMEKNIQYIFIWHVKIIGWFKSSDMYSNTFSAENILKDHTCQHLFMWIILLNPTCLTLVSV